MEKLDNMLAGLPAGAQGPISAAIILLIGIIVAYILRSVIAGAINRTGLGRKAKTTGGNIGASIGKAVFWLAILYALYMALGRLNMGSQLQPINDLFRDIAAFVPKLIGAGFTLFIGLIIAKVAKNAVQSTLEAAQVDNLAARSGMTSATGSEGSIAKALGTLVFVLIIIPVAVIALEALGMKAISEPLSNMLSGFFDYIPKLAGAAIILAVTVFIGRWIAGLISSLLPTVGFDSSINQVMMLDDGEGLKTSPSKIAGNLAFIVIVVLGLSAAVDVLDIGSLTAAFGSLQELGGRIITASITIVVGVFLGTFVSRIVGAATSANVGNMLKYAVIVLATFMGLAQLGIGESIVNFAFMAILGAATVASAIAFGLGGREWAGKKLQEWKPAKNVRK